MHVALHMLKLNYFKHRLNYAWVENFDSTVLSVDFSADLPSVASNLDAVVCRKASCRAGAHRKCEGVRSIISNVRATKM